MFNSYAARLSGRSEDAALRSSTASAAPPSSPLMKTRSLSDGGASSSGTPSKLSPSPLFFDAAGQRQTSKDDSSIGSAGTSTAASSAIDAALPVTPRRPSFPSRGLSLQVPSSLQRQNQQNQSERRELPSTPTSAASLLRQQQLVLQQQQQQQQQQNALLFSHEPAYLSKPAPLSPKLDPSQIYAASPASTLPRRSRGLEFSRAATSLHHSTLAEQSSPDESPSSHSGGNHCAMNIPHGHKGGYPASGTGSPSTSLWSLMNRNNNNGGGSGSGSGLADKTYPSSSLGSINYAACSDSSSSSDDDFMDDDPLDEPFVTTPQVGRGHASGGAGGAASATAHSAAAASPTASSHPGAAPWQPSGSPAMNSLASFQHRQRPRKQLKRKKGRGPLGLGFSSLSTAGTAAAGAAASTGTTSGAAVATAATNNALSRSPPLGLVTRRESISWAANQLHISGSESDDNLKAQIEAAASEAGGLSPGQRGVVRRVVTRRGNLLPKTKGFARIRAALAEESAPVESEFRREAEVVRQVLESDIGEAESRLPPRLPLPPLSLQQALPSLPSRSQPPANPLLLSLQSLSAAASAVTTAADAADGGDRGAGGTTEATTTTTTSAAPTTRSSPSMLDTMDDMLADDMSMGGFEASASSSSVGLGFASGGGRSAMVATTPPPRPSRGMSMDDTMSMDSPIVPSGAVFPISTAGGPRGGGGFCRGQQQTPTAADISRRIQSKRRRDDDDLDPASFKRRAVSPSISVHNSPIMQSPLQRNDLSFVGGANNGVNNNGSTISWGGLLPSSATSASRPSSNSGNSDIVLNRFFFPPLPGSGGSGGSTMSDSGISGERGGNGGGGTTPGGNTPSGRPGGKGRVSYQTMVDANDSITRLTLD